MPEVGDTVSDKYRILESVGAGAMGVVFRALHLDTEKHVALKWLNPALTKVPTSVERFKREAKATGRINHPNVVSVYDLGQHAGEYYIVMEFLAGDTLRAHLNAAPERRLGTAEALQIILPVMGGVAAAHGAGVLHRDLKPENVLLAQPSEANGNMQPVPKVLDFGLAKVRNDTRSSANLSLPGSVLGTYHYMAPELLKADGELDERSDVYALGAMLYEMLSGEPPYSADNAIDLVLRMHDTEARPLHTHGLSLPEGLSEVVQQALARDPSLRYGSVEELSAALRKCQGRPLAQTTRGIALPLVPGQGRERAARSQHTQKIARPKRRDPWVWAMGRYGPQSVLTAFNRGLAEARWVQAAQGYLLPRLSLLTLVAFLQPGAGSLRLPALRVPGRAHAVVFEQSTLGTQAGEPSGGMAPGLADWVVAEPVGGRAVAKADDAGATELGSVGGIGPNRGALANSQRDQLPRRGGPHGRLGADVPEQTSPVQSGRARSEGDVERVVLPRGHSEEGHRQGRRTRPGASAGRGLRSDEGVGKRAKGKPAPMTLDQF